MARQLRIVMPGGVKRSLSGIISSPDPLSQLLYRETDIKKDIREIEKLYVKK